MKIRITKCEAISSVFGNILPDSEHTVLSERKTKGKGRDKKPGGYWVQGVGEKVLVLYNECKLI